MVSGLGALGSIAGGLSQGLNSTIPQYFQLQEQNLQNTATGEGVYAMLGISPPTTPSPMSGLGSLPSGGAPNVPVPTASDGGGGGAQAPPLSKYR